MRTSPSTAKIDVAIAKAQRNLKKAMKDSSNPHFNSKYADLESVSDACMDAFTAEGIAIIQGPSSDGPKVTVSTRLAMEGEFYESDFTITVAQAGPQQVMAGVTYGRRAGLAAMTGVTPADDDGNVASGRESPPPAPRRQAPRPAARVVTSKPETVQPSPEQRQGAQALVAAAVEDSLKPPAAPAGDTLPFSHKDVYDELKKKRTAEQMTELIRRAIKRAPPKFSELTQDDLAAVVDEILSETSDIQF